MEINKIRCIDDIKCELGEGPIWHSGRGSWLWFDILNHNLYEYSDSYPAIADVTSYTMPFAASAMAQAGDNSIIMATEKCIASYDLEEKRFTSLLDLDLSSEFRTNEGGIGPKGRFWFSTMKKAPDDAEGCIYSIDSHLNLSQHLAGISIANTMIYDTKRDRFYISDSMKQTMYVCNSNAEQLELNNVFLDLTDTEATPDGATLDIHGNLWVALWGGYKVICVSPHGEIIDEIKLPVPQPTSCSFGGANSNKLFVTTARQGLSNSELVKYPLSGSSFIIEVDVSGAPLPLFNLDKLDVS